MKWWEARTGRFKVPSHSHLLRDGNKDETVKVTKLIPSPVWKSRGVRRHHHIIGRMY
jgi:hypothetical protein